MNSCRQLFPGTASHLQRFASQLRDGKHHRASFRRRQSSWNRVEEQAPPIATNHAKSSPLLSAYDDFLILDFEATCAKGTWKPQEIIEFPVIRLSVESGSSKLVEVSSFHSFVRPIERPLLTSFCQSFTGIAQSTVDRSDPFDRVLSSFDQWMRTEQLLVTSEPSTASRRIVFLTCGDWDLSTMLPMQCRQSGVRRPEYFDNWLNLQTLYGRIVRSSTPQRGLKGMVYSLALAYQGKAHSGMDDCRNIAAVLRRLVELHQVELHASDRRSYATFRPG